MSLPLRRKITWARVVATCACLMALAAYSLFAPDRSYADDFCLEGGCECKCVYAGQNYSEGATRGGQTCVCIHYDTSCSCSWQ